MFCVLSVWYDLIERFVGKRLALNSTHVVATVSVAPPMWAITLGLHTERVDWKAKTERD